MKEPTRRMIPHIEYIAEYEVAHRAALEADFFSFYHLDQRWVVGQVEPMANPLCPKQHGIVEFLISTGVALSCVQVRFKGATLGFCAALGFVDEGQEIVDRW